MRHILLINIALLIGTVVVAQNKRLIRVGDEAPALNPYKWLNGNVIHAFEPGKIYVVEFGSTWCSPCRAMIPVLTELQEKYVKDLTVISLFVMERNNNKDLAETPSYLNDVTNYIKKQSGQMKYAIGLDDALGTLQTTWLKAAGKTGIPHTFVIDRCGKIAWIGSNPDMLRSSLGNIIDDKEPRRIITISQTTSKANSIQDDSVADVVVKSALSKFKAGTVRSNASVYTHVQSYLWVDKNSELSRNVGTVNIIGQTLSMVYYLAYADTLYNQVYSRLLSTMDFTDTIKYPNAKRTYGKFYHIPVIESRDSQLNDLFNYSLKVGAPVSAKFLQRKMQSDLNVAFHFDVVVEVRDAPCWIVTVESLNKLMAIRSAVQSTEFLAGKDDDGTFTFQNADMRDIIWMLGSNYGYKGYDYKKLSKADQAAFLDETNFSSKIDFKYNRDFTFQQFIDYLKGLGIKVSKGQRKMKVVVIRDSTNG